MNFKEFTESIVELLKQKKGDTYTVTVANVLKNNDVHLTGVVIMGENEKVAPTIYLEEPYRQYQDGISMQSIAEDIIGLYEKHDDIKNLDMDFFTDFSLVKDKIFYKVINYKNNQELLKDVPHFKWHDLAVTFYYVLEGYTFGRGSILIHNNHLDMWGQSAEEVYHIAQCNMPQRMPEILVPLQELLEDMTGSKMEEGAPSLYVLTNKEKVFGASAMLYSEKIKELADKLGTDLLILPSSVHETLILADDLSRGYDSYRQMVREVNMTQVDLEEILSFNLYRYNRKKAEIEEITE